MILHTIISEGDIFYSPYNEAQNNDSEFKRIKGGYAQIKRSGGGYKVERLFSTDPSVYLRIFGGYGKP